MSTLRKRIQEMSLELLNTVEEHEINYEDIVLEQENLNILESDLESDQRILEDIIEVNGLVSEAFNGNNIEINLRKAIILSGLDTSLATESMSFNNGENLELSVESVGSTIFNIVQEGFELVAKILRNLKEWTLHFFTFIKQLFGQRTKQLNKIKSDLPLYKTILTKDENKNKGILEISKKYKGKFQASLRNFLFVGSEIENGLGSVPNGLDNPHIVLIHGEKNYIDPKILFTGVIKDICKTTLHDYDEISKTKFETKKMLLEDAKEMFGFNLFHKSPKFTENVSITGDKYVYITVLIKGLADKRLKLYKAANNPDKSKFKKLLKDVEMSDIKCEDAASILEDCITLSLSLDKEINSVNHTRMSLFSLLEIENKRDEQYLATNLVSYVRVAAGVWRRLSKLFKSLNDLMYYFIMAVVEIGYNKADKHGKPDPSLKAIGYNG